jgi:hypothetical protein
MIEKIKSNWKLILICLLVLFSLNKCTVSCNRKGIINKQNITILSQDSVIKHQQDSIKYLNLELNAEKNKGTAVQDAHNLGTDYYGYTIDKLNNEIKEKDNEIIKLKSEKTKLKNEILSLNKEIIDLKTLNNN